MDNSRPKPRFDPKPIAKTAFRTSIAVVPIAAVSAAITSVIVSPLAAAVNAAVVAWLKSVGFPLGG